MKFTVTSTVLNKCLSTLGKLINSKNSMQILECILFEVKEGKLLMTASDAENTMQKYIYLDTSDGDGAFCVRYIDIQNAVKELPEQPIEFDIDMENYITKVTYQNGNYNFVGLGANEYPSKMPMSENTNEVKVEEKALFDSINRAAFAMASEQLRQVMNGILFEFKPDMMVAVATDGHKLVCNKTVVEGNAVQASFILPKKPALFLKNILTNSEQQATIKFDEKTAEIVFEDGTLQCRLIEGTYPNYQSVIPQNNPNKIVIDRNTLQSALRRVIPFADESNHLVKLHIENNMINLEAKDFNFEKSAREQVACEYTGTPLNIGFNSASMNEMLQNMYGSDLNIELADPSKPGVITPVEQPEKQELLMLIMPMLLNN